MLHIRRVTEIAEEAQGRWVGVVRIPLLRAFGSTHSGRGVAKKTHFGRGTEQLRGL